MVCLFALALSVTGMLNYMLVLSPDVIGMLDCVLSVKVCLLFLLM